MTQYYDDRADRYLSETTQLKKRYDTYSFFRLLLALAMISALYFTIASGHRAYGVVFAVLLVVFVQCVKKHRSILWQKRIAENLRTINREESDFLTSGKKPFNDGVRYTHSSHFYTYDLDVFGPDSLFQHLNRTTTYVGEAKLARSLNRPYSAEEVLLRQEAIKELSADVEGRQRVSALGRMMQDNETGYRQLLAWSENRENAVTRPVMILAFVLPALFIFTLGGLLAGWITWKWMVVAFTANLMLTGTQLKKIKSELIDSGNVAEIIRHYGLILGAMETGHFRSALLTKWQETLGRDDRNTGKKLEQLSKFFLKLQGINFDLGALALNGTVTYHIHALRSLLQWKQAHAAELHNWLEVMGEIEALNSYANFAFNNPGYTYPALTPDLVVDFEEMGHPLIRDNARVDNSIRLTPDNFMILTGSNMSGKSTFLRALGINMVLAGTGAPVCAQHARVHLMPVLVSMRQSDSLSSGESYFFAEVKRLKAIMDQLELQPCLVLLDEILRGTNSDDKQSGTIGVIKRIISRPSLGGIATHDLAVCRLTDEYPDRLENKNFEVEIVNGELVFDYKLRSGICRNKSATFLMKKMEII